MLVRTIKECRVDKYHPNSSRHTSDKRISSLNSSPRHYWLSHLPLFRTPRPFSTSGLDAITPGSTQQNSSCPDIFRSFFILFLLLSTEGQEMIRDQLGSRQTSTFFRPQLRHCAAMFCDIRQKGGGDFGVLSFRNDLGEIRNYVRDGRLEEILEWTPLRDKMPG